MFTTPEEAETAARKHCPQDLARGQSVAVAIVLDQIVANGQDTPEAPWHYCAAAGVPVLFTRFASVLKTIEISRP